MNRSLIAVWLLVVGCVATTAGSAPAGETGAAQAKATGRRERGLASFYADSLHGRRTASGERYDRDAATCAHRTHRFGTRLDVTVVATGRKVTCRVNDRGPFVKGRVVDVSRALARKLGIVEQGVAEVIVEPAR